MKTFNREDSEKAWTKIKNEYNFPNTEELFSLEPPVDYQCEFIDEIRDKVGKIEVLSEAKRRDKDELDVLRDKLEFIEYEVNGLEDDVEKLREVIENVRSWGQDWKNLCKKIILNYELDVSEI